MIKINLIKERGLARLKGKLFALGYAVCVGGVVCGLVALSAVLTSELTELETEKKMLKVQIEKLKNETKVIKDLEQKKQALRDRIMVIAKLKKSKTGPVKVLDHLNTSLPQRAWLKEIKQAESGLNITGYALSNETVAEFVTALQASEYFPKVTPVETKALFLVPRYRKEFDDTVYDERDKLTLADEKKRDRSGVTSVSAKVIKFTIDTKIKYEGDLGKEAASST